MEPSQLFIFLPNMFLVPLVPIPPCLLGSRDRYQRTNTEVEIL